MIKDLKGIIEAAKNCPGRKIAVAAAADLEILEVACRVREENIGEFIFVGDEEKILSIAEESMLDLGSSEIIDEPDDKKAVEKVVELIKAGGADVAMKGMLHTATFMRGILNKEKGLSTGGHISQVSLIDKIDKSGIQYITDGVISLEPDLMTKVEIIKNAVKLAHALGNECPTVACVGAVEVVNPKMPDTMDAAILSKMNDRGQITGCIIDGPFGLDNAISKEAAEHKKIDSPVAGNADILLVPSVYVGNPLIKSITYYAGKDMASAIIGPTRPVVMTSRTDSITNKVLSIALAVYLAGK
ncbi:MAG: bifunctional enoyl-CoA hydratase/phosphate acetyltransferase [Lachnospiraceae bacterium]|nr:bifunctional enoyl-CoA hydratase/phosphate acetyltransferase [Lachnospiraceae bacterium]